MEDQRTGAYTKRSPASQCQVREMPPLAPSCPFVLLCRRVEPGKTERARAKDDKLLPGSSHPEVFKVSKVLRWQASAILLSRCQAKAVGAALPRHSQCFGATGNSLPPTALLNMATMRTRPASGSVGQVSIRAPRSSSSGVFWSPTARDSARPAGPWLRRGLAPWRLSDGGPSPLWPTWRKSCGTLDLEHLPAIGSAARSPPKTIQTSGPNWVAGSPRPKRLCQFLALLVLPESDGGGLLFGN